MDLLNRYLLTMNHVQPLSEDELNGPGFKYVVKYKLRNSDGSPESILIDDPTSSEVVIHNKEIFRQYEISVQSSNEKGLSTKRVVSRIGYTGEGSQYQAIDLIHSIICAWPEILTEAYVIGLSLGLTLG